jgi:Epoxide hydrolase N terminus
LPYRSAVRGERRSPWDLVDLRRAIAATRWPSKELVEDRSQGVQLATLQEFARYWEADYDWRKAEAKLNALPQFKTEIDGVDIHFIHVRSPHENALPLIMTHGWPGFSSPPGAPAPPSCHSRGCGRSYCGLPWARARTNTVPGKPSSPPRASVLGARSPAWSSPA